MERSQWKHPVPGGECEVWLRQGHYGYVAESMALQTITIVWEGGRWRWEGVEMEGMVGRERDRWRRGYRMES